MLTRDAAFAVMCRMLGLEEITDIIRVPDATIREKCGEGEEAYRLANLLISLKKETQWQAIAALGGSEAGAAGAAGAAGSGTYNDDEERHRRMAAGPVTRYGANGIRQW